MLNSPKDPEVIGERFGHLMHITLNRPRVINSLDLGMIRLIQRHLDEAENSALIKAVVLDGRGAKGFCAGGDIKGIYENVRDRAFDRAMLFFQEEYALDLRIHDFPKPVIVLANGITMGGGLGLAAGADIVVATEHSRMAMPESRIGFFPDVGATGWLFSKCPKGYPEFLGLTGYEMVGAECVRLGLATHLAPEENLVDFLDLLKKRSIQLSAEKREAVQQLTASLESLKQFGPPENPEMDGWIRTYFAGKTSLRDILADLSHCRTQDRLCKGIFERISERSPTSLVLTLRLLRHNQDRPLDQVFPTDAKAARFMIHHPDYLEGVRARIMDKDDHPVWNPDTIKKVDSSRMTAVFV